MEAPVCMARKGERISDDWSKEIRADRERRGGSESELG